MKFETKVTLKLTQKEKELYEAFYQEFSCGDQTCKYCPFNVDKECFIEKIYVFTLNSEQQTED